MTALQRLLPGRIIYLIWVLLFLGVIAPDLNAQGANYRIRANDVLAIDVHEEKDLSGEMSVARDGSVKLHLLEKPVKLAGLTAEQAAKKIAGLYAKGYLRNPQVNVRISKHAERNFTVLGQVNKEGTYALPADGNFTFMEAIGKAGGFTRLANRSTVVLKRKVKGKMVIYKVNAKKLLKGNSRPILILEGDVIQVNESIF